MSLPFKFGLGGPIADGQQGMSWIHIDDMISLIIFTLEHSDIQGAINATAPNPKSNSVFSKTLAKTLHRPAIMPLPACVLKVLMGEMAELAIYGQYVIPKKLLDAGFVFRYPELSPALSNLFERQ